jgi:predicted nucleic acid-binding protein
MRVALDTNILVRLLVRDDEAQFAAAQRLVEQSEASGEPVLLLIGAVLETE